MKVGKRWWTHQTVGLLVLYLVLTCWASAALAVTGPSVNVMPSGDTAESAYTWAGNSLTIWGNVKTGDSTSGTFSWDFDNDGVVDYTGSWTAASAKDLKTTHTYTAAGLYEAKLTVTDGNGLSDSAIVRIYVKPAVDKSAQINLAIEKGLKWLYLQQGSTGAIYYENSNGSAGAETSAAALAFENKGHKPCTKDLNGDGKVDAADRAIWEKGRIYAATVHKALDYAISTLTTVGVGAPFDSNGNGIMVRDNYASHNPYKIGLYMTALVAAGDTASGAPDLVATTGPAGITGKTYKSLIQDMVDFVDYAQYGDPNYGGWRYNPGDWPDNSACQWATLGLEAAQTWNVPVRAKIKTSNMGWLNYSQYSDGRFGYTCPTCQGTGGYTALTGAGLAQLGFQGVAKTDTRVLKAGDYLKGDKGLGNMYYMYSVAKGARNAKDSTGAYSPIQLLGNAPGWDWYSDYSTWLINNQGSTGYWYTWGYTQYVFDTAFAVEILTQNVFTLRPVAKLVAPATTTALSPVTFDISGSHHQDPTKLLTNWWIDVNGDGTYELSGTFPVTSAITYSYPDQGKDYTVNAKLKVGDNSTPQETSEDTVAITVTSGNVPPVANPGGPYNGVIGSPITFDASASYDPNACPVGSGPGCLGDYIDAYEWDLDGDGTYETVGKTVQKTWNSPYSGQIGLRVKDHNGQVWSTAKVYTQVFVVDLWPENYVQVSQKRISTYVYEYTYKFDMRNRGNGQAKNVKCTLVTYPSQFTIMDGTVLFGDIDGNTVQSSGADTFTFRQDRRYPATDKQLRWKLEYDYIGSDGLTHHQLFADFPLM